MSATRNDRNYRSWATLEQQDDRNVVLAPLTEMDAAGQPAWPKGSWQDTAKFYRRRGCLFDLFKIETGGTEDGVDISSENHTNVFRRFWVQCGDERALTLKGGSCDNLLEDWLISGHGKIVEEEFGCWSSSSTRPSTGNTCTNHQRTDGQPVRYAYVLGSRPTYLYGNVRHVGWWSACLTLHWWAKYCWHRILRQPDGTVQIVVNYTAKILPGRPTVDYKTIAALRGYTEAQGAVITWQLPDAAGTLQRGQSTALVAGKIFNVTLP